jgi:methyl-accepting chemotaxis protein
MRRLVRWILLLGLGLTAASIPLANRVAARFASGWELAAGLGLLLGIGTVVVCIVFLTVIFPLIERGSSQLVKVAEQVADGDLRMQMPRKLAGGWRRQWMVFERMIDALRRLAAGLRDASDESQRTSAAIRSGAEATRESARRIAEGTEALHQRAEMMSVSIEVLVADSSRLTTVAASLRGGAQDGVARNARMRAAAAASRREFAESARLLDALAADTIDSATAVESLAAAAEEIAAFTTLITAIARQSRLLSLNAAMEAARAGELGEGFAVVAAEVRRLAQTSGEAAERTSALVQTVLGRVRESREKSERVAAAVVGVTAATKQGTAAFDDVERASAEADAWAASIVEAAASSDQLARALNARLAELAHGTTALADVARELAATGKSQQASAQAQADIAGRTAANAETFRALSAGFQLPDGSEETPPSPRNSGGVAPTPGWRPSPAVA